MKPKFKKLQLLGSIYDGYTFDHETRNNSGLPAQM